MTFQVKCQLIRDQCVRIYSWPLAATALLIVCVRESMCLTYLLINLHAYQIILEFGHRQFNIFEAMLFVSCCFENFHIKALIARPLLWLNLNLIWLNFVVIIDIFITQLQSWKLLICLYIFMCHLCVSGNACCLLVVCLWFIAAHFTSLCFCFADDRSLPAYLWRFLTIKRFCFFPFYDHQTLKRRESQV